MVLDATAWCRFQGPAISATLGVAPARDAGSTWFGIATAEIVQPGALLTAAFDTDQQTRTFTA